MKRKILLSSLSLVGLFYILTLTIPVQLGEIFYGWITSIEARVSALDKQSVDIGEVKMTFYQNEFADRPTILMLHGFSADKDNWLRFARHFTDDYNVVIPDMAGHGETGFKGSWNYSAPTQAERLIKFLDQLKIEKVHVIGNSMGGFISAHFAKNYPQRTLTATFIDPTGVQSPQPSDMGKMLAQGKNPFMVNNRQQFDKFYHMTMAQPPYIPDFVLESISEKYQSKQEQLKQIFKDTHEQDGLDGFLNEIKAPTLLMWGGKDRLIHVSSVDVWKAGIKDLQVKIWPEIGHMAMLEIPKESAEVYREFLEQVK